MFKISFNYFNMIAARYPRREVADCEIFWSTLVGLELKYLYEVIERKIYASQALKTNILSYENIRVEMEAIDFIFRKALRLISTVS